jgi:hypothetical protein
MKAVSMASALGALALLVGAPGAAAAGDDAAQRTDPQAGSPAGVIYQIPLDTGRRDAAPAPVLAAGGRGGGGSAPGGGSVAAGGSGGGSHPSGGAGGAGAAGTAGSGNAQGAGDRVGAGGSTEQDPSSIHSENGFGSSSKVPGVSPAAALTGAGVPAAHTAGSSLPTYLLLILIAATAIAVGFLAGKGFRRSRTDSEPGVGI